MPAIMLQQDPPFSSQRPGARCAWHEERPATVICTRCGSYACDECRNEGPDRLEYCDQCVSTVAVLAGRDSRFVANLVDQFALFLPAILAGFAVALLADDASPQGERLGVGLILLAALATLGLFGYQLFLVIQHGQSLGKRMLGLRVVRSDGSKADAVRIILLRNVVPGFVNFACSLFGLVDALFIFTQERRCLHDIIADTKVVKVNEHTR
jgi:uncharacterized RDD family membrane protein YckC